MHIKKDKLKFIRSVFALTLAGAIVFGSVFTVAAAVQTERGSDISDVYSTDAETTAGVEMVNGDIVIANMDETGISIDMLKANKIIVNYYGKIKKIYIAKGTVADVLDKAGIKLDKNQVTEPALSAEIKDDMVISVYNGRKVSVTADGETKELYVPKGNVEEVLNHFGYRITEDDLLNVSRNSQIWEADKIIIKRVVYGEETVTENISYDSLTETSDKIDLGETKLKTKGAHGKKLVTRKCKYIDGKKISGKIVESKTIKKPTDKVTLVGTRGASVNGGAGTFTDMYGNSVVYSSVHTGSGTAYTAPAGASTATGVPAYHGGVAVNPNIIPYGSKLYIVSTDGSFVYGYATAVDTGGALMDGSAIVDCFYNTYVECVNFGRRDVNVYVVG